MPINKVVFGNETLIDLTTDTVASADDILLGKVGHLRDGTVVTGTASGGDPHGTIWQDGQGNVHLDDESGIALQSKTVTPTESQQIVEAGEGYYALDKVTVGAIDSTYVGSNIARRSADDLMAESNAVIVPAGYYANVANKAVAVGTAGTPTVTKGTVSNHAVTVTPSVTNTTGYITGGTKTGTGVSVSASELVSGTYSVNSSGTKDVTNYASISVPAGTAGTPTATKSTVSNYSIAVTPSVTNTTGYITGGKVTGTSITVKASELVSGTRTIGSSGTTDVTNYASVSVPAGTEGTPTISKSSVIDGQISLVPRVENSEGYIAPSGAIAGERIYVSASELVSGTYSVTSSGTKDVTNYASVSVPAGTEGTPTATKGTVSNHSVTVTPKVTNTGGYITGSTKTGTAITVSASELVSGTYSVNSSGTLDVANYASISVPAGTEGTPTAIKGSVYNHSVSVTPSVTNVGGYIGGNTKTGTAVIVTASELVSGTKSITENGTGIDVTNYASVNVDVQSGGFTASITHTTGSSYIYPSITVNGSSTDHYADGDTFGFNYGDTFDIWLQGTRGGGLLYINNALLASSQDSFHYIWTPPACDLEITIQTSPTGRVDITYPVLNISTNGTYNVSGYGEANVNVTSVPSVVTGTFTPNSTDAGTAVSITIPYTDNGYPIEVMIDVDGGVDGNTAYAELIDQYSMARIFASKTYHDQAPTYTGSGTNNYFRFQMMYKSSNSAATSYAGSNNSSYITSSSAASASSTNCIRFNSATAMSIFVKSTSYGFSAGITYRYLILYSS